MKKILLFIAFIPLLACSQDCYSKKDPFTGITTTAGTLFLFGKQAPGSGILVFSKNINAVKIIYSFESALASSNFDAPNMLLLIKFKNEEVRIFKANSESVVSVIHQGVIVGFAANITSADVAYLHDNPISVIRLSYKGDQAVGYDTDISESLGKKIINCVACML